MTEFEQIFLALLIPLFYALVYTAGKYDFLNLVGLMIADKIKSLTESEDDGE